MVTVHHHNKRSKVASLALCFHCDEECVSHQKMNVHLDSNKNKNVGVPAWKGKTLS
jgi:hypothetical protein